ncbi:MAG: hypothetical protein WC863_04825 [Patescibacteria group bacterium]
MKENLKSKLVIVFLLLVSSSVVSFAADDTVKKKIPKSAIPSALNVPRAPMSSPVIPQAGNQPSALTTKRPAADSSFKVGGQIFFRWQKYLLNGTVPNNFDIDRAYFEVFKKLERGAVARVTLDAARIPGAARQNLFDYLKYAYFEMPLNRSTDMVNVNAKLGMQQTIWIDWTDKMLSLRWIAKSLTDNENIMSSSDLGVSAYGKINLYNWPAIEYQASAMNGTGYATAETDSSKSLSLRLNSTLLENPQVGKFILGAYSNSESVNSTFNLGAGNHQAGIGIGFKHELRDIFFEYVTGTKSNASISGYSIGGVFKVLWPDLQIFARADSYDPDTSIDNDTREKTFYGVIYDWSKDIRLSADVQNAKVGNGAVTSAFYLHSLVNF